MPYFADSALIWGSAVTLTVMIVGLYTAAFGLRNRRDQKRLREAVRLGIDRPAAQAPYVDPALCIGCASCVAACPESDVLGIVGGMAVVVNGLRCVGHARCEEACPVGALTVEAGHLWERDDVPLLDEWGEASVPGVFVVGELSGLALIRNAVRQGRRAVGRIAERLTGSPAAGEAGAVDVVDVAVVGAGPAGLTAALAAVEKGLTCRVFEQEEDLGGTILHYPQKKLVLTQPEELPLGLRMTREEYSREELLEFFTALVERYRLDLRFGQRVVDVAAEGDVFRLGTGTGVYRARSLVLGIGRRGTPRRLGVPGEELAKVRYQLRDAASYRGRRILVVGGGDSAVEAAAALARQDGNEVVLSYRRESFVRIRKKNELALGKVTAGGRLQAMTSSRVLAIEPRHVRLAADGGEVRLPNDDVLVLIGSEPALPLLHRLGLRFGGPAT